MAFTQTRPERINTIINELTFVGSDFDKGLFEQLCRYTRPEDVDHIFSLILSHRRLQSITLLISYLINIDHPYSLEKYVELFAHENLSVRQEACITLEKIPLGRRRAILIEMLNSSFEDVVLYALGEIYRHSDSRALHAILKLFDLWDNKEIQIEAIRILRQLQDGRALPVLERLAEEGAGDIQEEAFLALEKFALYLKWPMIKKWLRSNLIRQRQIAYLTMARKLKKKWSDRLAHALNEEEDTAIKLRILTAIRDIRTPLLFKALLKLCLSDPSPQIRNTAQTALVRINRDIVGIWLMKELPTKDKRKLSVILHLLGFHLRRKKVRLKLFEIYGRSNPSEKLIILNALSQSNDGDTSQFLRLQFEKRDEFSYSALAAYLKIFSPNNWRELHGMITAIDGDQQLIDQLVLDYIYQLPQHIEIPGYIVDYIEKLVEDPELITRSLAARCFSRVCSVDKMNNILVLLSSTDFKIQQEAIFSEIVQKVNEYPEAVTQVVKVCLLLRNLIPYTAKLFNSVAIENEILMKKVLDNLFGLLEKVEASRNNQYVMDPARVMLFMRNLFNKQKSVFLNVFKNEDWTDAQNITMMTVINSTELHEFEGLNVDFMAEKYKNSSLEARRLFLKFFKKLPQRSDRIEDTVLNELTQENQEDIFEEVSSVIGHWA